MTVIVSTRAQFWGVYERTLERYLSKTDFVLLKTVIEKEGEDCELKKQKRELQRKVVSATMYELKYVKDRKMKKDESVFSTN